MSEKPLPPLPTVGVILSACFAIGLIFTALKTVDLLVPRATVIVPNLQVKSAPSEGGSTLFEMAEGADVVLRQEKNGWTQIRNPGGMSGWVQQGALFQTSGIFLW